MVPFPLLRRGGIYVIAEAGVNHNGDLALARQLIDVAAQSGADAVKFQMFDPDELAAESAPIASYQAKSGESDQKAMLQRLALPREAFKELKAQADSIGIDFLTTPFDSASARFLTDLHIKALKLPSGELTNIPFLHEVAALGLPTLLSTGMATMEEVVEAVEPFEAASIGYALLHCVSSYPAPLNQINLKAMATLRDTFHVPVGYSDHSEGIDIAVMAAALGAEIIEKHFTLDRTMQGPDHAASLEPAELAEMIRRVRDPKVLQVVTVDEQVLGDGEKKCQPCEEDVCAVARRSVVVTKDLPAGTVLAATMLAIKRPGTGIPPGQMEKIVGKSLTRPLAAGSVVLWNCLA